MNGMERKILLVSKNGYKLSVVCDYVTDTYSISVTDGRKPNIKFISKELYDLLCDELETQKEI